MQMAKILKDTIGFEEKVEMIQAVQEKDMAEVKSDLAELKTQLNEVLKICQEIKKEN